MSASDRFAPKVTLTVSSIVILACSFDERDIREGLSDGGGHGVMIPLNLNEVYEFIEVQVRTQ